MVRPTKSMTTRTGHMSKNDIDVYLLVQTAITIDRIQTCEVEINQDGVVDCT